MSNRRKALADRVIVITNASSGIGLVTARQAGRSGGEVVAVARNAEALDGLVREIEAADGSAIGLPCEVGREMDVAWAIEAAIWTYGRIDTWVNNAGMRMAR